MPLLADKLADYLSSTPKTFSGICRQVHVIGKLAPFPRFFTTKTTSEKALFCISEPSQGKDTPTSRRRFSR